MKITERAAALIEPKIRELGFDLWDVEFNKEYGVWELLITIDRGEPVTLDDCEKATLWLLTNASDYCILHNSYDTKELVKDFVDAMKRD